MKTKRILAVIIALCTILITLTCSLEPDFQDETVIHRSAFSVFPERQVFSRATLEDNFRGDRVLIVLNQNASRNFREYTANDFSEIGNLLQVTDLTRRTMEIVRMQKAGDMQGLRRHIENGMLVNIDNFRRILSLELSVDKKEYVLDTIQVLQQRNDILYAGPAYFTAQHSSSVLDNPPYFFDEQMEMFERISLPQAWDFVSNFPTQTVNNLFWR